MMSIKDGGKYSKWHTWYKGQPFPVLTGKVVQIQADGDELEFLLSALKKKEQNDIP